MEMEIVFPGGKIVETRIKGTTITVGADTGSESGVEPLDLFLASLGLCAGKYIMEFCRPRDIPYDRIQIFLVTQWDDAKKMHTRISIQIKLPQTFPVKYKKAVVRAVNLCSVKKHILNPPAFEVEARISP
jgi:putative redox protein